MAVYGQKKAAKRLSAYVCRETNPGAAIEQHAAIVGWWSCLVNTGDGQGADRTGPVRMAQAQRACRRVRRSLPGA